MVREAVTSIIGKEMTAIAETGTVVLTTLVHAP